MHKYRTTRPDLPGAGRGVLSRPQRATGLTGPTVGIVLDSSGTRTNFLNASLAAAHLVIGLVVMLGGLQDIVEGGPTRPAIIPFTGAYMSAAVVFWTALREKRPAVLAWILALSDVVLLSAVYNLTLVDLFGGHEITLSLTAGAVFLLYAAYGIPTMSLITGCMTGLAFMAAGPAAGYVVAGHSELVRTADVGALVILLVSIVIAFRVARAVKIRTTRGVIERLQRIECAVSMRRTIMGLNGSR